MVHADSLFPLIGSAVHLVNALLAWLVTYAIHSTILIGGLLLLTATTSGRRLVAGHGTWLWRFALVGAIVTASLQSIRSAAPLTGTLRLDGDTPQRTMVRIEVDQSQPMVLVTPTRTSATATQRISTSIDVKPLWPIILLGAWFAVAAALVTWFLVARARFLRFIGPRRDASRSIAGNALRHLCREGGFARDVRLTLSERLTSPVALGADEICLPERALSELDPIRMESILAHELAHLVRRDPTWLTIARLIEAVFFFQPLNVLARRRMQEAAEFASDAWASTRVARPLDLAHCLARVAEWTIASPTLPVPAMAERRGKVLVRRVERLTTGRVVVEQAPGRSTRLAAVVALLALVLLAPRAAIGAEGPVRGVFSRKVPEPAGFLMLRQIDSRPVVTARREGLHRELVVVRLGRS
jgi:bla regulator protein blaR1